MNINTEKVEIVEVKIEEIDVIEAADVEWFPGDGNVCKTSWK